MAKRVYKKRQQIYTMGEASRHKNKRNRAVYVFLIIVILLLVAAIAYLLYSMFLKDNQPVGPLPTTAPPNAEVSVPTVTYVINDSGEKCHRVTFYGKPGQAVEIPELGQRLTFSGAELVLDIPDKSMIGETPVASTVSVTLHPRLILTDSTILPIQTIQYSIDVESSSLTIVTPSEKTDLSQPLYDATYTIRFLSPLASKVYVNGVDVTSKRDTSGMVTYVYTLQPIGEQDVVIEATEPYKFSCTKVLTFIRPTLPVKLEITDFPTRTTADRVTIKGYTDPSAMLSCYQKLAEPIRINATTGEFSMTLLRENYGETLVQLFATKDGNTSQLRNTVYFAPDVSTYTRNAWKLETGVFSNPNGYIRQTFLFSSVDVVEVVETNPTVFKASVALDGSNYTCYFKYTGSFSFKPGDHYRIFADVIGTYNGSALMIIYEGRGLID